MKTKSMLVVAIALMSSVAFAVEPGAPRLVVVDQKSGMFKVIYENGNAGKVKMTITDNKGKTVFIESINVTGGFVRPVNFAGMAEGEYFIEIAGKAGKDVQKVTYSNASRIERVHVSKIAAANHKYLLSVANKGDEQMNVKIFDGANNLVHDQNVDVSGNFGLVYNLTQVDGNPTFEITDKTGYVRTIRY